MSIRLVLLALVACPAEQVTTAPPTVPETDTDTDADADTDTDTDTDADTDPGPIDTGFARGCTEDAAEPNDTLDDALPLPSGGPLAVGEDSDDVWRVTLPAGRSTTIEVLHEVARGDIDIEVLSMAGELLARGRTDDDDERVVLVNHGAVDARVFLRVTMWNADPCNTYEVVVVPTPAMACPDDPAEPNDVPAQATALETVSAATAFPFGPDLYAVDLWVGDTFRASFSEAAAGELDVTLYDPAGQALATDDVGSVYTVTLDDVAVAGTYLVDVRANGCVPYTVDSEVGRPPLCTVDANEPDDIPSAAAVLLPGVQSGLSAGGVDTDVSRVALQADELLDVQLLPTGSFGAPSLRLTDVAGTLLDEATSAPWRVQHAATVAEDVYVTVEGTACFDYGRETVILQAPDCSVDDVLDQVAANDTYPTASLVDGLVAPVDLLADPLDNDNLRWTVPDQHRLRVEARPTASAFGLPSLSLWDIDPTAVGAMPVGTDAAGPVWDVEHVNTSGVTASWTLRVEASACMDYTVDWALEDCAADDASEPNDTPATARVATTGVDQIVNAFSDDHWALGSVGAGRSIVVDVDFLHVDGDLDATLLRADGAALIGVQGGSGSADGETVRWTNATTEAVDVVLRVTHDGSDPCRSNTYGFAVRP